MGLFKKSDSYFKVLNKENYASIVEAVQTKFGLTSANEAANHIFHKGVEAIESETHTVEPKTEYLNLEKVAETIAHTMSDMLATHLSRLEERLQSSVQQETLEKLVTQIGEAFAMHLADLKNQSSAKPIEEPIEQPTVEESKEETPVVDEAVVEVEDTTESEEETVRPNRKGARIPLGFISTSFNKKGYLQRITLPSRMTRDLHQRGYVGYKLHKREDGVHVLSFTKRRNMKTYQSIGYYANNNLANLCFSTKAKNHIEMAPQNYLKLGEEREIGEVLRIHVEPTV